jgi:acyl transferase domain-containing protein
MERAFVFAGQGCEEPEMGLALAREDAEARSLLARASEACGADVERALERGGRALDRTEVLQPVLAAVGLAAARALERRGIAASCALGHSLGELVAACFAADLDPLVAIDLAAERGSLMAQACVDRGGAMAAVRAPREDVARILPPALTIAAHNADDEIVISGSADAIETFLSAHRMRASKLRALGAWHSDHVQGAVEPFRARARSLFAGRTLRVPFYSACTASAVDVDALPDVLADGLVREVRFAALLRALEQDGLSSAIALAPSRVVRGLLRRAYDRRVELHGADDPSSVDAIARKR